MKKLLLLLSLLSAIPAFPQNGKKVYADYHGVRYTRQHDGKLGRWEMYANTEKSSTGRKSLCYNADLIDNEGKHEIAAVAYPQVGMQSNLDPDYMEYQILSAKAAKIDGFFIEWGFKPHENDLLLREMQKVATKYDFEIGINWCDGWLYYDWITKIYPEINTREAKTEYMTKCYQYLVDSVFTGPTAPMVKGMPVFYHFGPGANIDEYRKVLSEVKLPQGMKQPVALRRWADWGKLENNKYIPVTHSDEMDTWKQIGEIPTAWIPARVRERDAGHAEWDHYATQEDVIEFMKPFRDSIWHSNNPAYTIKSGFAMPGMDNRGCAGWGRSHFFYIPRNNGETYSSMWQFCMAEKDNLDMMFIASWSDYTEGHEIEPTIENGDRELRTTLKYAAAFKGEQADERGLSLPLLLFHLRKEARFLEKTKMDVSACHQSLDKAALLISQGRYSIAIGLLSQIENDVKTAKSALSVEMKRLRESDLTIQGKRKSGGYTAEETLSISLPKELVSKLQMNNYVGYLYFEYLDKGKEPLFIRSSTTREPKEPFKIVSRIYTDNTGEWKSAKVELYKENIVNGFNMPTFYFKGNVVVRNLSLGYSIYTIGCSSSIHKDDRGCSFTCDSIQYSVEFLSEECVRILSYPKGDTLVTKRLVVDVSKPTFQDYTWEEKGKTFVFRTPKLSVFFDQTAAAFTFQEVSTGKVLLKEKGHQKARSFNRSKVGGEPCLEVTQRFIPTADEAIYGLGQYQNGIMNYRGKTALLLQANMDIVNPFLISTNGYGILWDNYSSTRFEDTDEGYSFTSEVGDASDYYFMYGKNMDEVVAAYRNLTGDVPMFGKWVYGFWQSKERYKSFDELKAVVREYRKRGIPLDNIVQDWEYWGDKPHWNSLTFHPTNFSNPRQVIEELQQKDHVHFMLSVWPGFGPKTAVYQSLDSIGALFNEPTWAGYKVFDAYNPAARDIFWQYLKKGLYDMGVDAWWMDATEPSFRDGFTQLKQEERTKSAGKTYLGSFHRYLNTYSLEMLKDFYQRLRAESNQKRAFILTRSAFASQQHYGTAVWSGDVSASWENMHKQLAAGLNLSMSGIPYWTSDTGGFFVTERDAKYPDGLKSDDYKELYARWFQFSAFTPIFRAHGTNVPREVWQFGKKGTPFYDNQVKYIRLRYRLLPYIYSMSYQVTAHNYTMLRGLAMDFTTDPETFNIDNAYMFGSSLLVRPVFFPQSEEQQIAIYLPEHKGKYWYDFWTGEAFNGGGKQVQSNKLDVLPLYVKAGSILPLAEVKQYAMEYPDRELELRIYGGADASFLWYEDEGDSYRYEEGICAKVSMQWQESERILTIGMREGNYPDMPEQVKMHVKLYLPGNAIPESKECLYTGEEIKIKF